MKKRVHTILNYNGITGLTQYVTEKKFIFLWFIVKVEYVFKS